MTELLVKNSKIAKSNTDKLTVYNFGLPAYQSKTGLRTCPSAGVCAKGCYATQGSYIWSTVAQAYEWRLEQTLADDFVEKMVAAINVKLKTAKRQGKKLVIRIHDSGDYYSLDYVAKWFEIMLSCPEVTFYSYTKQVKLFKNMEIGRRWQIPSNLILIYSFGGIHDKLIDIHTDRHASVFSSNDELDANGYANAMDNDLIAIGDNPRIGLVYHGAGAKEWTAHAS